MDKFGGRVVLCLCASDFRTWLAVTQATAGRGDLRHPRSQPNTDKVSPCDAATDAGPNVADGPGRAVSTPFDNGPVAKPRFSSVADSAERRRAGAPQTRDAHDIAHLLDERVFLK